jgi:DNA relaxase NicK
MQYDTLVDYLTVSFRCAREWKEAVGEIDKLIDLNAKRKPWFFYGYSGFSQSGPEGHYARGKGQRGGIVQASGEVSHVLCQNYEQWLPDRAHFTRLDLALTFTLNKPISLVRDACDHPRSDWTVVLPHADKGGGTLYVGNRKSASFGRLYDKGAELNQVLPAEQKIETGYLWRAELEVKKDCARALFSSLVKAQARMGVREFIADTVLTWFSGRGVYLPVIPNSSSIVSVAHRASDDMRAIKWLHEQVRPCVWRLAERGLDTELAEALGILPENFALDAPRYLEANYNQFSFFDQLS